MITSVFVKLHVLVTIPNLYLLSFRCKTSYMCSVASQFIFLYKTSFNAIPFQIYTESFQDTEENP